MARNPDPNQPVVEVNPYHLWHARFWHGMLFTPWVRLVVHNRFRIGIRQLGMAITITFTTALNSLLRPLQELFYGRLAARTQIKDGPIFILGHWRSGTTLLHELLVLDDRYTYPTTYQCLVPNHFLISRWLVTKLRFLLPKKRPMDHMVTGWDKPQEDEFALMGMGLPSPYLQMAFPNEPLRWQDSLSLDGLSELERNRWKAGMEWFLKRVTLRTPKRVILKSPPHTARIKVLLELFPDARFVHIVRDPYPLFGSTVKLWKTLYKFQALQPPNHQDLEDYVFDCFEEMYQKFERDRPLVSENRFFEVRYEDLVRDPIDSMRALYEQLELGEFEAVEPQLRAYFAEKKDFRTDTYQTDEELRERIDRRWGPYMRKYGYCPLAVPHKAPIHDRHLARGRVPGR